MKKATALALLFIFLFNIAGYSVLYWIANRQAAAELAVKLDNGEYSGSQTMTIRVPVSLPYQTDTDFERVNGEFEYQGQYYKLVKQRVLRDTLQVVVLIDNKKKELAEDFNEYTRSTNESTSGQSLKVIGSNPLQEYSKGYAFELTSYSNGWEQSILYSDSPSSPIGPISGKNSPPPKA